VKHNIEGYDMDDLTIAIDEVDVAPAPPLTDDISARLVDQAVASLISMRFPLSAGDATAELHALTSLIAQATARIPGTVADAADQDYPWDDIAICLDITPGTARRRYAQRHTSPGPPLVH
jgi:hypothetical protein